MSMSYGVGIQSKSAIIALIAAGASAMGNGDRAIYAVPGLRGFRSSETPVDNRSLLELPEMDSLSAPLTQILWAVIFAISTCVVISCCCTAAVQAFEIYRRSQQRTSIIDRLYANKEPVGRARRTGGLRRSISLRQADPNYISRADQERQLQENRRRRQSDNGIKRNKTRAPASGRTELTIFSVGGGKKAIAKKQGAKNGVGAESMAEDGKNDEDDDEEEEAPPAPPPAQGANIPGADDMDGRFEVNSTYQKKNLRQRREEDIRRRIEAQKEADRREREVQERQAREARAAALQREQEEASEAEEEDSQAEDSDQDESEEDEEVESARARVTRKQFQQPSSASAARNRSRPAGQYDTGGTASNSRSASRSTARPSSSEDEDSDGSDDDDDDQHRQTSPQPTPRSRRAPSRGGTRNSPDPVPTPSPASVVASPPSRATSGGLSTSRTRPSPNRAASRPKERVTSPSATVAAPSAGAEASTTPTGGGSDGSSRRRPSKPTSARRPPAPRAARSLEGEEDENSDGVVDL